MKGTFAKIVVKKINNTLCVELNINNKLCLYETNIDHDKKKIQIFLIWWMLKNLKPLFFEMPLDEIGILCSKDAYEHFGGILENCTSIIRSTAAAMKSYSHLKGVAKCNKNILFFNVDDTYRYKSFYKTICNAGEKKVIYMNMSSGFNVNTRTWENKGIPMPLDDLIDIITKKSIKKIVSISHYLLNQYLTKTGCYLIPLFQYLGVEYIIIDNDLWDDIPNGYVMKAFFNCSSFDRFSYASSVSKYWDNKYELKNVQYIAVPYDYDNEEETRKIKDDYAVLILSNSRLDNVKLSINNIIYMLNYMPENSVFTEVQMWYLSLRYMILKIMKLGEFEQLHFSSLLHQFFYTVMQFLKYEIIDCIDTEREIEIYGDVGWDKIFPEHYKKLLNIKEMDMLFSGNGYVYLLLNFAFSYVEASGPFYDATNRNVPFITTPPMVKTHFFEGFRHIEYKNKGDLNYLIENIQTVVDNEELKKSTQILREILKNSKNELVKKIALDSSIKTNREMFGIECKKHRVMLEQAAEKYISRNEAFLRESFNVIFLNKPSQFDVTKSKYFNRRYVQRILQLIRD